MPKCEQCRNWTKCRNFLGEKIKDNTVCDWDPSHFAYSATYVQGLEATIAGLTDNNTRLTAERLAVETERDALTAQLEADKRALREVFLKYPVDWTSGTNALMEDLFKEMPHA